MRTHSRSLQGTCEPCRPREAHWGLCEDFAFASGRPPLRARGRPTLSAWGRLPRSAVTLNISNACNHLSLMSMSTVACTSSLQVVAHPNNSDESVMELLVASVARPRSAFCSSSSSSSSVRFVRVPWHVKCVIGQIVIRITLTPEIRSTWTSIPNSPKMWAMARIGRVLIKNNSLV